MSGPVRIVELPGCGHSPHREAPEDVLAATEEFLGTLP
ncbi:MAG TPA: alpha/beta hydrolase [Acidimicrobiales bacterium]|nr:alpha/beta hydrolase [Acidimicrobiales bacterium]